MRHHSRQRAPRILVAAAAAPPQVGSAPSRCEAGENSPADRIAAEAPLLLSWVEPGRNARVASISALHHLGRLGEAVYFLQTGHKYQRPLQPFGVVSCQFACEPDASIPNIGFNTRAGLNLPIPFRSEPAHRVWDQVSQRATATVATRRSCHCACPASLKRRR